MSQSPDHSLIRGPVNVNTDDDAKVEHELIALVLLVFDADWMPKDADLVVRIANCDISIAESLARNYVLCHRLELKKSRLRDVWLWGDASWGALVDDFRS